MNAQSLFQYTINLLAQLSIKHDVHNFSSGASMLDIWHNGKFYVLQFEDNFIGFSEINHDNVVFDTNPDEKFYEEGMYKAKLESFLN